MLDFAQALQTYYIVPLLMLIFVSIVGVQFFRKYRKPAQNLNAVMEDIYEQLNNNKSSNVSKHDLDHLFEKNDALRHAWSNYKNSLHDNFDIVEGEQQLLGSRSTVPSEIYFSQAMIVDTPLRIEYYKHLPGIVTGVGIIATFGGLLFGLLAFDPAGDPAKVQDSLGLLLGGVAEAFMASALAIAMAMIITWVEKSWLRKSYAQLEQLTTAIDSIFDTDDTGEEYLEKLLKSSQANEANARQLKDSLVNDLKTMMTNLVEENKRNQLAFATKLTESYAQNSQNMAEHISKSITDTLHEPLDKIASSVQQVSGDQGTAVHSLMTDVLTAFMTKLESTFGSQMTGMSEMMSQSVTAMKEMQLGFNQLVSDMKTTSEQSSQQLETQMSQMLEDIQAKQLGMSEQMNNMVDHLSNHVTQMNETGNDAILKMNEKITDLVQGLSQSMNSVLNDIGQQRQQQDEIVLSNQQKLHDQSSNLLQDVNSEIKQLIEYSQNAVKSYQDNIQKLTQVTTDSVKGMNQGADKMRLASEQFNMTSDSMSRVVEKTTGLVSEITQASGHLHSASSNVVTLLADYKRSQDSVNQVISTLDHLIKQAQSEAGLNKQMLTDMNQMTTALNQVKQQMQEYLDQVSNVLSQSFESFGSSVESSLNHSLGAFDNTLDQAVKRLATGVEGLGEFVEDLEDLVRKKN